MAKRKLFISEMLDKFMDDSQGFRLRLAELSGSQWNKFLEDVYTAEHNDDHIDTEFRKIIVEEWVARHPGVADGIMLTGDTDNDFVNIIFS